MIILRYLIAGGTGAAVNVGTLFLLTHYGGVYYLLSATVAFFLSYGVSFVLQKFWTFEERSTERIHGQAALYLGIFICTFFLNLGLLYLLVERAHIWYVFAQVFASGILAGMSFFIYRHVVFASKRERIDVLMDPRKSFKRIVADLDFYQSIISRNKGRLRKYPWRTLEYILKNRFIRLWCAIGRSALFQCRTFWGERMDAPMPEFRSIWHFGILDGDELAIQNFLVDRLHVGDTFLDVGAHAGFYTLLAAALIGEKGRAYAFEPTPSTFSMLQKNIVNSNSVHRTTIFPIPQALFSAKGAGYISDFGFEKSGLNSLKRGGGAQISIQMTTIDLFCRENNVHPSVIKIDTEEAEYEVLQGAEDTVRAYHPMIVIEVTGEETHCTKVTSFLTKHSYSLYVADEKLNYIPYQFTGRKRVNIFCY